jgi:hypothetical protein
MKVQIVEINGNRFALPTGTTTKDVQTLAGMLLTLQQVDYHYLVEPLPGQADRVYYMLENISVRLTTGEVLTKEEADSIQQEDRTRREAKKAAEAKAA